MRKYATVLVVAAVIMLVAAFAVTNTLFVMERVAAVESAAGDVQIKPRGEGEFRPLGEGRNVKTGDTLRTGSDASVELSWVDGTRLKLDSGTTMTILKCSFDSLDRVDTSIFRVDLGRIWVRVVKILTRGSKFEVQTPAATAGIRGTVFSVDVGPDGATTISVWDGSVALAAGGANTEIPGGQVARIAAGGSSAELESLSSEAQAAWQEQQHFVGPYLSLTSPVQGAEMVGSSVHVEGDAEPHASVTVNEQAIETTRRGHFSADLPVADLGDPPTVTVVATDRHDAQTTLARTLARP
ncbi:MAG: FecR domain-containing protein [Armatimonadota bacterium]